MPATVKCVITLPDPLEPLIMGIHTIDAQTADVAVSGSTMTVTRKKVFTEDGYVVHIILAGSPGLTLTMDVFVGDGASAEKQNDSPISPIFRPSSNAYEFLFTQP